MTASQQRQPSKNWNDMPYAALQLIADYHCVKASDALLVVGCVCKRWHDAAVNYLPADAWRRFYDHLVKVHYRVPEKQIAEAKLPTPDTLQAYSYAAQHWYSFTADARALRETFRGVENMPDFWNVQALGTVAEWRSVNVESGRVTEVDLSGKSLRGSVDLTKLPAGLRKLQLSGNKLSGTVDLLRLPAGLQELHLNNNKLSGSADLLRLPASIMYLGLNSNQFSGSVDLTQLPAGLRGLYLYDNKLSGSVDLTQLPAGLRSISVNANKLSGPIDLTRLPVGLRHLCLSNNNFSGSVDVTPLPAGLQILWLHSNKLSGSVDLTQLPEKMRELYLHNNKFEGSTSVNIKTCEVKVDDTVQIKK